jgi:hypothetical protein
MLQIMFVTMIPFKHGASVIKQSLDPKPNIKINKPLTIENNLYNSKPMTVFPHETVYHVIRCNLVLTIIYMNAFIISLLHYLTIIHTFSQKKKKKRKKKKKVHSNQKDISCEL